MDAHNHAARDSRIGRRFEYDDAYVVALDLPFEDEAVDVDVVGTTAMLVVDDGDTVSEAEFELPGEAETVDLNNGVLTIRINK